MIGGVLPGREPGIDEGPDAVVLAAHVLERAGLGDHVWGHVSLRSADPARILIKGSGSTFGSLTRGDVATIDSDGNALSSGPSPPAERFIHTEILRRRPDVGAVVHVHSQAALSFMALGSPVLALSHEGALFVDGGAVEFTETSGLITTPELGARLAERLGEARAALLPGHGTVIVGRDVAEASVFAIALERACQIQIDALAAGPLRRTSTQEDAAGKLESCWSRRQVHQIWSALKASGAGLDGEELKV